jgi:hypothetical protein
MDDFERACCVAPSMLSNEPQQQAVHALKRLSEDVETPMTQLQHGLLPWVAYGVLPIFAFANAGIPVVSGLGQALTSPVTWGVVTGLVVGKPLGITLFAWLAVRAGIAVRLPAITWTHVFAVAWLGGIGFAIFVALIGTRTISHFHAHLKRLPFTHGPLIVALALMLGLATVATMVGLAAIIGAFLAGVVMSEEAERYDLEQAILPIYEFVVPFFFVIMGTRVDPALFLDRQIIGQAVIITVVAIVAKLLGAGTGSIGLGLRSVATIGIGMVPRGEVGLIVASLGLSRGIIGTEFFSMVVVMSIVTTLVVPPALAWLSQPRVRRPAPARGERMGASGRLPGM